MTKINLVALVLALIVTLSFIPQVQAKSGTTPREQGEIAVLFGDKIESHTQAITLSEVSVKSTTPSRLIEKASPVKVSVKSTTKLNIGTIARWEGVRKCIVKRESHGIYSVVNRSSKAQGAYQFMPNWRYKLARMFHRPFLAKRAIHYWSKYWQDRSFWKIWNNGQGRSNWAGGNYRCW